MSRGTWPDAVNICGLRAVSDAAHVLADTSGDCVNWCLFAQRIQQHRFFANWANENTMENS